MDIDDDKLEAGQWKKKYFDQLDEAERNEKQWRSTEELLRKAISRLTLAADGLDDTLDRQLLELRNAIRDHASAARLQSCIDELSRTLTRLDEVRNDQEPAAAPPAADKPAAKAATPAAEPAGRTGLLKRLFGSHHDTPRAPDAAEIEHHTVDTVREVLIRLLERLALPAGLVERTEAIRSDIMAMREGDSWDRILEQIADLIQSIRQQTQEEKQGIEEFLVQLTERLEEVGRQMQGSEQYYDELHQAGTELDQDVAREMSDIGKSVSDATDLGQLRQAVQAHIDSVLDRMQRYREVEQQRYDRAKAEISSMNERLQELEQETSQLRARVREERNQAMIDALTGIPNRLAYEERLQQEVARWKRFGTPLVLAVWDIDLFKRINDSFGHRAGDKVLRTIARSLESGIRETDFVARYGGEEFVQLMTGSSLEDCLVVADKLRENIKNTGFHFREQAVVITASCGLAEFRDGDSVEQWFERADKALYKAKQEGRNRCELAL